MESRRWRVLIIDDEPAIVRGVRTLMSHHDVVTATSGEAALELLRGDAAFDAVVCDLLMPDVSGMDLYQQVSVEQPGLERRFVFVTGGAFMERARAFLGRIDNVQIDKPFTIAALEAAIALTIERARGQAGQ